MPKRLREVGSVTLNTMQGLSYAVLLCTLVTPEVAGLSVTRQTRAATLVKETDE